MGEVRQVRMYGLYTTVYRSFIDPYNTKETALALLRVSSAACSGVGVLMISADAPSAGTHPNRISDPNAWAETDSRRMRTYPFHYPLRVSAYPFRAAPA